MWYKVSVKAILGLTKFKFFGDMVMRKILFVVSAMFFLMFSAVVFALTKPNAKNEVQQVSPEVNTGLKIGVIDTHRAWAASSEAAKLEKHVAKRVEAQEKEVHEAQKKFSSALETFRKNSSTMKPDVQKAEHQKIIDQQKKLQDMQTKLQAKATVIEDSAVQDIIRNIKVFVDKIASEKHFDLIFYKSHLIYNEKDFDITDAVIQQMKK